MAHDVFISHSARDKPYADGVCAKLESLGIRCWIAPRDIRPGMEWGAAILEAIDGARVMLLVFSSHANGSPQISREVERAVHKGLVVIPVRIEDVQPSGNLEYFLGTPHWLDAITPPFERHLARIADSTKFWLERINRQPASLQPVHDERSIERSAPPKANASAWLKGLTLAIAAALIAAVGSTGYVGARYYMAQQEEARKLVAEHAAAAQQQRDRAAEQERERKAAEASAVAEANKKKEREEAEQERKQAETQRKRKREVKNEASHQASTSASEAREQANSNYPWASLRAAAARGDPFSQYMLGIKYEMGDGVAEDDAQAVAWYRKAAEQRYADAENALGVMYDSGRGVEKDCTQARQWYARALADGSESAKSNLYTLDQSGCE